MASKKNTGKKKEEKNKVDDVLIPDEETCFIGDKEVKVTELPRREYKKLTGVLSDTVKGMKDKGIGLDNLEDNIGKLMGYLGDEALLKIYSIATGLDEKFIDKKLTMRQEVRLLNAILEVNHIEDIAENFTELITVLKPILLRIPGLRVVIEEYLPDK